MFGGFFQKKNWVHCICFNAPPIWTNLLFVWITTSFKSRINAINLQNLFQCYMLKREAAVSWVMAQNVCNKGVSLTYFRNKCQLSSVSHELRLGILLSIFLSFVMSLYIWYMYICVYMCILMCVSAGMWGGQMTDDCPCPHIACCSMCTRLVGCQLLGILLAPPLPSCGR